MAKGWHKESRRHSMARKGVKSCGRSDPRAIEDREKAKAVDIVNMELVQSKIPMEVLDFNTISSLST